MSAPDALPSHVSFEQLRKQAKDLLKERRAAGETLQLKDAQRLLAEKYGFATWADLKNRAEGNERTAALKNAIDRDDVAEVRRMLQEDPSLHRAPMGYNNDGPLTWAAECRGAKTVSPERLEMVRAMVQLGSDIHQGGDGPLMRACLNATRIPMIELLLDLGADVNARWNGNYPIILAPCEGLSPEVLELLLRRGARPDMASEAYGNALEMVIGTYGRQTEAQHACVELLVQAGAPSKYNDLPCLDIHRGRLDLLEENLKRAPELVHRRFAEFTYGGTGYRAMNLAGTTLLHVAAEFCELEAARLLLRYGADVNARADRPDGLGQTPIYHAVSQYHDAGLEVVRLLLDAGADLTLKARVAGHYERPDEVHFVTPLGYATRFPFDPLPAKRTQACLIEHGAPAGDVYAATRAGYAEELEELIRGGADLAVTGGDGETALGAAVAAGRPDLAERLLEVGAPPSFADLCLLGETDALRARLEQDPALANAPGGELRFTPAHHAASANLPAVLEVLHAFGAALNARDGRRCTPLHRAVHARATAAIRWLLDRGVPVDTPDWTGRTALFLAAEGRADREIIDLLIARGASTKLKIAGRSIEDLLTA